MLSFLVRLVLVLLVARLVLRGIAALVRVPRPRPSRPDSAVDLVRDRICDTFLPRTRAVAAVVAGHEELFCSPACAKRALAEISGRA